MMKPKPRPWKDLRPSGADTIQILADGMWRFATKDDLRFAVAAVNLHDELTSALSRAVEVMQFAYMNAEKQPPEIEDALELLEKAGAL